MTEKYEKLKQDFKKRIEGCESSCALGSPVSPAPPLPPSPSRVLLEGRQQAEVGFWYICLVFSFLFACRSNWCCRMLQVANHRCVLCVANHMFGDAAGANCWGGRTVGVLVPWNALTLAIAAIATRETHVPVPGKVQYFRSQVLIENEVGCNVCTVEMWCDFHSARAAVPQSKRLTTTGYICPPQWFLHFLHA